MANFLLSSFLLALLVITVNSIPDYRASGQKLVKIKERDRTKNVYILKKSEISNTGNNQGSSSTEDASSPPSQEDQKDTSGYYRSPDAQDTSGYYRSPDAKDTSGYYRSPDAQDTSGYYRSPDAKDTSGYYRSPDAQDTSAYYRSPGGSSSGSLSLVGGHGVSVDGGCVDPDPEPAKIFGKFATTTATSRMYLLTSSRHYADQASLVLTGKPITENNPAKACIRVIWENGRRRLQGFGQKSLLYCKHEDLLDITCHKSDNGVGANIKITYVWADGQSNVLAIMCANGRGSWAILGSQREIERETREAMLQVVESYGFDPEDNVDFSWAEDDCAVAVGSQYNEGPCVETDDDLETVSESKKDVVLRMLEHGVYTPLSSYANAYATGMFIRGTPVKSNEELDNVCVRDTWSRNGDVERKGFWHLDNFLECDMTDFTRITCVPNEAKADEGANYIVYNRHVHPVWTDGKKYVLTYNCLSTNMKTWSLYSTSKETVPHDLKIYILAKVADYGFDTQKSFEPNYESCLV